jgi:hypothetical protein
MLLPQLGPLLQSVGFYSISFRCLDAQPQFLPSKAAINEKLYCGYAKVQITGFLLVHAICKLDHKFCASALAMLPKYCAYVLAMVLNYRPCFASTMLEYLPCFTSTVLMY